MDSKIVEAKNITFTYGSDTILHEVSLEIGRGDFLGIIGPNGSGKSTLMKICTGLIKPQQGTVKIFGTELGRFRDWGQIGYIPQKATAFNQGFPATVAEVVRANLYPKVGLMGRVTKEHLLKVEEVLDTVGMLDFRHRMIGKLSGGQQQKVFIAKALVSEPKILFMDEPTVGIDRKSEGEFYELMDYLNKKKNITIVMVTHDIGAVNKKVNRIVCVSEGKVTDHRDTSGVTQKILEELYGPGIVPVTHSH